MALSRNIPSLKVVVLILMSAATVCVVLYGKALQSTISSKPLSRDVLITDKGTTEGAVQFETCLTQQSTSTKTHWNVISSMQCTALEVIRSVYLLQSIKRYSDYCNDTLLHPQSVNMKRISSYQFPCTEKYIEELFPKYMSPEIPDVPLFITGFSDNHFKEGLALIDNFENFIKVRYPEFKLHVYDVGITAEQKEKVKLACNCIVETFPLEKFPEHDRILEGYGWKPLVMQYAARNYRFVIWMDACIRFNTSNIDDLLAKIKTNGIVAASGFGSIAMRTLKETFDILNEQPCLYGGSPEIGTNFVAIRETDVVRDYIMKPWVSCALIRGCLVSSEDVRQVHPCERPGIYHKCHRFDQSVLGILIHRLNHAKYRDNVVNPGLYFSCCRDCFSLSKPNV